MSKHVTQADVAKRANVSRSTVSLVLSQRTNGPINISEDTQQRVIEAAQELGYMPNLAAQMLAQGRNYMLGVFSYGDRFPIERVHKLHAYVVGIEREASRQDYNVLLITRGQSPEHRSVYGSGVNELGIADGGILMGWADDYSEVARLAEEGYPFVYIGRREIPGCDIDWVVSDYVAAGRKATNHLLTLGHRRLAYTWVGPVVEEVQDRLTGCQKAAKAASDASLCVYPWETLINHDEFVAKLHQDGVTGLICGGSGSLRESLEALARHGLDVPADVSVLGLSFDQPHNWAVPGLEPTHVSHRQIRVGELAVKALMKRLAGKAGKVQHILVENDLRIGNSTQALA
jgi:DNA-binding LacI/PurR family transcriptional regulator